MSVKVTPPSVGRDQPVNWVELMACEPESLKAMRAMPGVVRGGSCGVHRGVGVCEKPGSREQDSALNEFQLDADAGLAQRDATTVPCQALAARSRFWRFRLRPHTPMIRLPHDSL